MLPMSPFQRFSNELANLDPIIGPDLPLEDRSATLTDPTGRDVVKVNYALVLLTDEWIFTSLTAYLIMLQREMEVKR